MLFSSKSGCLNIKNLQAQATIKCCTPIAASTPITIRFQGLNILFQNLRFQVDN